MTISTDHKRLKIDIVLPFISGSEARSIKIENEKSDVGSEDAAAAAYEKFSTEVNVQQVRLHENVVRHYLYERSKDIHIQCVQQPFLRLLLGGDFCPDKYVIYLTNILAIHKALEMAQERIDIQAKERCFVFQKLFRSSLIAKDLIAWKGLDALQGKDYEFLPLAPATMELVNRINGLTQPRLIVAVTYALYGTVLNGTHRFASNVQKVFAENEGEGEGDAFFHFEGDVVLFRDSEWGEALLNGLGVFEPLEGLVPEVRNTMQAILTFIEQAIGKC